jgi:hypothetical protein
MKYYYWKLSSHLDKPYLTARSPDNQYLVGQVYYTGLFGFDAEIKKFGLWQTIKSCLKTIEEGKLLLQFQLSENGYAELPDKLKILL